eukprot:2536563-Rhodomonas_salina.1
MMTTRGSWRAHSRAGRRRGGCDACTWPVSDPLREALSSVSAPRQPASAPTTPRVGARRRA